jgi:transcriptional regulator with XRE-family HTH domain
MSMMFSMQDDHISIRRRSMGRLFGRCIRNAREKGGRTVEQAAWLAGMELSQWQAVETGYVPNPEQLRPMADALGISFEKFSSIVLICQEAWQL